MDERFAKTKLVVGILTLIGIGAYTGISLWQTWLIRTNNIVSQRAFIIALPGQISPNADRVKKTGNIVVFTSLTNTGNTATSDLHIFIKCAPSQSKPQEPFVLLFREETPAKVSQLVGPHQAVPVTCEFPISDIEAMFVGKAYGYIVGEFTYKDRLDPSVQHRTQMAYEMIVNSYIPGTLSFDDRGLPIGKPPVVQAQFSPVGLHNCADEDCPN